VHFIVKYVVITDIVGSVYQLFTLQLETL